jgi:hypothetical protein
MLWANLMLFSLHSSSRDYAAEVVDHDRTALTYRYERWRAVTGGILETAGSTFLLLIAVRWFESGASAKALLASGSSVGLLLTPLVVQWVESKQSTPSQFISRAFGLGALICVLMAALPSHWVFIGGGVAASSMMSAVVPLFTQIYQENYPAHQRGR